MSNALSEPSFFSDTHNSVLRCDSVGTLRNIPGIGNRAMYVGQSSNENCTIPLRLNKESSKNS